MKRLADGLVQDRSAEVEERGFYAGRAILFLSPLSTTCVSVGFVDIWLLPLLVIATTGRYSLVGHAVESVTDRGRRKKGTVGKREEGRMGWYSQEQPHATYVVKFSPQRGRSSSRVPTAEEAQWTLRFLFVLFLSFFY